MSETITLSAVGDIVAYHRETERAFEFTLDELLKGTSASLKTNVIIPTRKSSLAPPVPRQHLWPRFEVVI